MPMKKRPECDSCHARFNSKQAQREHVCGKRAPRNEDPGNALPLVGDTFGTRTQYVGDTQRVPNVSRDTRVPNENEDLQERAPGHVSSSSSSPKEREEGHEIKNVSLPDPEPIQSSRAREDEAIRYLSARTEYLKPWERSFFLGVRLRDRALTDKQKATLFEIEAIVQGYEAENERWREENRRAQHPLESLKPGHDKGGCRYCQAEAESAARAKVLFEEDMAELQQLGEERKARQAKKDAERLERLRIDEERKARGRAYLVSRSLPFTPKAARSTPFPGHTETLNG